MAAQQEFHAIAKLAKGLVRPPLAVSRLRPWDGRIPGGTGHGVTGSGAAGLRPPCSDALPCPSYVGFHKWMCLKMQAVCAHRRAAVVCACELVLVLQWEGTSARSAWTIMSECARTFCLVSTAPHLPRPYEYCRRACAYTHPCAHARTARSSPSPSPFKPLHPVPLLPRPPVMHCDHQAACCRPRCSWRRSAL